MASCQGPCVAALCLTMLHGLCSASPWTMKQLQRWPLLTGRPWSRSWRWPGSRTTKLLPTGWRYALLPLELYVMCTAHTSHFDSHANKHIQQRGCQEYRRQLNFCRPADFPDHMLCTVLCDPQLLWPDANASCTQLPIEKPLPRYHNYPGLLQPCCMRCNCAQHTLPYHEELLCRLHSTGWSLRRDAIFLLPETSGKHGALLRRLRWTDWRLRHQAVLLPAQCAHPGLWKGQSG